jgi:hypothetical protein
MPLPAPQPISTGLFVAALVLWGFTGWTWWILLPLFGASLIIRLVMSLFFEAWRQWAGPAVLVVVVVFLMGMTTWRADLMAFGTVGHGIAWGLRLVSPKWMRWVALGVGLAMVLSGGLAQFVVWANNRAATERDWQAEHDREVSRLRPDHGVGMMNALIRSVSEDDQGMGCFLFTPPAAVEFAEVTTAPDCPAAIHKLHGQITNPRAYANATVSISDSTGPDKENVARVSGCNMQVSTGAFESGPPGGPTLGQLRLEKDPHYPTGGYLITGYTQCGVLPPGVTPTTATPPPILPSYAPGYAGTLAEAAAERDTDVCVYFTDQGRAQFAAALGVANCAAAVRALGARVTDPELYRNPHDAKEGKAPDGTVNVDACHLTWSRLGSQPGDPPPGPQLGMLTLTTGPRGQGYLVDGYRPCP